MADAPPLPPLHIKLDELKDALGVEAGATQRDELAAVARLLGVDGGETTAFADLVARCHGLVFDQAGTTRDLHGACSNLEKLNELSLAVGVDCEGAKARDRIRTVADLLGVEAVEGTDFAELVAQCYGLVFGTKDPPPSPAQPLAADGLCSDHDRLSALLDELTAGEQLAECCICFDVLHERPIAAFTFAGRRTCRHFFHDDCARELMATAQHDGRRTCPVCRSRIDARMKVPKASDDPVGWFECVDVGSDGRLSRADVMAALISQFPIDHVKLEAEFGKLWERCVCERERGAAMSAACACGGHELAVIVCPTLSGLPSAPARPECSARLGLWGAAVLRSCSPTL